jgi:tetrahydromethanopterin S-methyltransferase subunit F
MNNIHKGMIFAGIIISILLLPASVYLTAAGIIITATLFMLCLISESAGKAMEKPILVAYLGDDGRSIIVGNIGNKDAVNINISLIPANLEFAIDNLSTDIEEKKDCGQLIGKNRAIMEYSDDTGTKHKKTSDLNFKDCKEYDPTKPLIPIFQ